MRLLNKLGYKGGGLGVNGQGMTQPLEVVQRPRFIGLGYTEGEFSKVSEACNTFSEPSRKEDDGDTSKSSDYNAHRKGRARASCHR